MALVKGPHQQQRQQQLRPRTSSMWLAPESSHKQRADQHHAEVAVLVLARKHPVYFQQTGDCFSSTFLRAKQVKKVSIGSPQPSLNESNQQAMTCSNTAVCSLLPEPLLELVPVTPALPCKCEDSCGKLTTKLTTKRVWKTSCLAAQLGHRFWTQES